MRALFVHDVKALLYDDKVFARSYGYNVWEKRYLQVFNEITVVTRSRITEENPMGKIDLLSGSCVKFDNRVGMFKGPEVFFNIRVRRIIQDDIKQSDFVICRLDSFLGLLAIHECKKIKKPYLIEVAGCAWDSFWNHGLSGKIIAPTMFFMMKKAIWDAHYVIYVTKDFLEKRYPTKGKFINISNVELLKNDETILEKRLHIISKYNQSTIFVLGTAANVNVRYKGQQFVIEALGILKKKGITNFIYELPGAGDNAYLKKCAEENNVVDQVIFLGSLTHESMMEWYEHIDIYIQPSLQEGLPRSVIEAMSFAIPCVGTDVAGIPELLSSSFIVSKKNVAIEIASKLKDLNIDSLKTVAKRNFMVSKEYDFTILNKKRKDFLQEASQKN